MIPIRISFCIPMTAGLFDRHWHILESVPIFCTFSRENAWKMSLCVCVCVLCIYIYIYIYIYQHMIMHFSTSSTYDSGCFGLFPRDKSIYFRHSNRHLQGTLSTFDIDICRHLNRHLYPPFSAILQTALDLIILLLFICVCVCCFVFIKPILGNRYGPGVIP